MSNLSETAKVVIVGAGPVGLTTALGLARHGVKSIVLEKKATLDPHSRATLIAPSSLEDFQKLGVLDAMLLAGARNDSIRIVRSSDCKELLEFDFSELAGETPTPFALALSQDQTEKILLDAVLATGLVDVHFSSAFASFEQLGDHVLVRDAAGRTFTCDFLVAADGARSGVRKQLGWELEGKTYATRAILADVRIDMEFDTKQGWLVNPDAESFTFAIRFAPGIWRIMEASVPDSVTDADLLDRSKTQCEAMFGQGAWQETLWTSAYRKHERRSARYVKGCVILAGDAAHLNSPAGGQGLNTGIADADLLVQQLIKALSHPAEARMLLADYEQTRIKAFDEHVRGLTDSMEKMESAPAWLRRIGFSMIGALKLAGIERIVARKLSGIDAS
jgi:3-(3-hydroxy-phenyl)propionate hydroxylase